MPELRNGGLDTGWGAGAWQLGSDPTLLAENAARLAELGSHGVDLNWAARPSWSTATAAARPCWMTRSDPPHRGRRAPGGARPMPVSAKMCWATTTTTVPKTTPWPSKPPGPAKSCACPHQGSRLPPARLLGAHCRPQARSEAAAGGQWRNLDGGRRAACPGRERLHQPDAGPGIVADPGLALAIRAAVAAQVAPSADRPLR